MIRPLIPGRRNYRCGHCGATRRVVDGEWLRAVRVREGLSIREIAGRVQLSAAYICDIENNHRLCPKPVETFYRRLAERQTEALAK